MSHEEYRARVAAVSALHACACARLLKAHGRTTHARNLEAAVDEVARVLALHLGAARLLAAMDWASDRIWSPSQAEVSPERPPTLN